MADTSETEKEHVEATLEEITIPGADGASLTQHGATVRWMRVSGRSVRAAHFPADSEPARGDVILLTGRTEFIEKYLEPVAQLRARGFRVHTLDWTGHGLSTRPMNNPFKDHVESFEVYLQDLRALLSSVPRNGPRLVMAHSLGGHVALRHMAKDPGVFDHAVLLAPMVDVHWPLPKRLVRLLSRTACRMGFGHRYAPGQSDRMLGHGRFQGNPFTTDRERFFLQRAWVAHNPRLRVGGVTWGWIASAVQSTDRLRRPITGPEVTTPAIFCLAGRERVVDNRAARVLASRMPNARIELFAHARHEILSERAAVRDRFWNLFDEVADETAPGSGPETAPGSGPKEV